MMIKIKPLLVLLIFFLYSESYSQKWVSQKWVDGEDLTYLRGQTELLLKFNYSKMSVHDIHAIKLLWQNEMNIKKEFSGKEDSAVIEEKWVQEWEQKKKNEYEPIFEKYFNQATYEELKVNRFAKFSKYTMLVNVLAIYNDFDNGAIVCDFQVLIFQSIYPTWPISEAKMSVIEPGNKYSGWQVMAVLVNIVLLPITIPAAITGGGPIFIPIGTPKKKYDWNYFKFSSHLKVCFGKGGLELGTEIINNR